MNIIHRLRCLKLANVIEAQKEHFNMNRFIHVPPKVLQQYNILSMDSLERPFKEVIHHCGTTACIAGWSNILFNKNYTGVTSRFMLEDDFAQRQLGITYSQCRELFYRFSASNLEAAECLRNLAFTSEVDWGAKLSVSKRLLARRLGAIYIL